MLSSWELQLDKNAKGGGVSKAFLLQRKSLGLEFMNLVSHL